MKKGVYAAIKKDGTPYYRSSITFQNKHISLGSFPTEAAAARAYNEADGILHDPGCSLESYLPLSLEDKSAKRRSPALTFPNWVKLINFLENCIYFKTPIFMG